MVLITAPKPVKDSVTFVVGVAGRRRDWMNANSWLVNIIAYVAFILLILF